MRMGLIGAAVLAVLYGLLVTGLFLFQRRLLFVPNPARPAIDLAGVSEMTVTTQDGLRLLAWYLPPADAGGLIVLYLHGNAGHIGHRAWRLPAFQQQNWGVMLLEYRGYGDNPGTPSEAGLRLDAEAGLAALQGLGVPPGRIVIWGESLGTGLAMGLAAAHPVAAVCLEAPYTSIAAIARGRFPFAPVDWLIRDRFDTMALVDRVSAPVLVMHGARDAIVPVAMGRAVFAALKGRKALWIAPDAGHNDLIQAGAIGAAAAFLDQAILAPPAE